MREEWLRRAERLRLTNAVAARDQALALVEQGAPSGWMTHATGLIRQMTTGAVFTTDDLWYRLGKHVPPEPRAMGAVIHNAHRGGMIEPTGIYRRSSRVECHARPVAVWVRR
jgi:hypothetical protein